MWQHGIDQSRALMFTHLSFCEKKDNWPAGVIANRVQLGVPSAFRAADETGRIPLLSKLAAVRCALGCVLRSSGGRAGRSRLQGWRRFGRRYPCGTSERIGLEGLVGAIDRGRIPPSQTIYDNMDDPAEHAPVVHVRNATRPREKGSMRLS